ncbi:MAG: carboxypeptidase-like regulatory domain-containing protein, partial [Chitinophagales bacterium]
MKFIFTLCIFIILLLLHSETNAQSFSQTIYGKVISKSNLTPLNGASIEVLNTSPPLGTTSSLDGLFIVKNVLIGVYSVQISSIGYSTKTIENISVTTGKQVFLDVQLDEIVTTLNEVVVQTESNKGAAVNSMTLTGVKTFSIEETQKFAAAINDPSRMATSLPGVVAIDDVNNDISIRGNSPNALLWRLEGIDIPNPNHFANIGSSGGGISILSSQLLTNSDFLNGAFPAEYGNALSGVFDLKLRKGNNQRREYTFQAGFIGLDASTEGPFKQGYDGSYLVNYRYSSLRLFELLGIPLAEGVSKFQDLSFNIFLPTNKIGSFTVFGLGGLSSQTDEKNLIDFLGNNELIHLKTFNESNTGIAGVTHLKIFNEKFNVKSVLAVTGSKLTNSQNKSGSSSIVIPISSESYSQENISFSSTLNIKTGSLNRIRAGISPGILYYSVVRGAADSTNKLVNDLDQSGSAFLFNGFAQWFYNSENHFSANLGIHLSWFALNQSTSIEPRA